MMDHHDFCIEINVEHIGQMWESKVNLKTNLKNLLRMGEILLSRTKSLEIQFNKCMNKFSSSIFPIIWIIFIMKLQTLKKRRTIMD